MVEATHWMGQRALLVEFGSLAEVLAFHQQLSESPLEGQRETVVAARTVFIDFRARSYAVTALRSIRRMRVKPKLSQPGRQVSIDVHYDGADLTALAETLALSPEALIDWHTSTTWRGAFCGFAPGFTYCVPEQHFNPKKNRKKSSPAEVPRLDSPRTRVPAGAVALAGEFSAVYPFPSPGGWQLIGTTTATLWDSARHAPASIIPGDEVRYRRVPESIQLTGGPSSPDALSLDTEVPDALSPEAFASEAVETTPANADAVLTVISPGLLTLIQDLGRRGFSDLGVPRSGAADLGAARQGNQLVGNADSAPVFEILPGNFEFEAAETLICAVTGAQASARIFTPQKPGSQPGSKGSYNSRTGMNSTDAEGSTPSWSTRDVPARAPFWIFPGERFQLDTVTQGLRCYLAVSGGIAAEEELGSCATDTLSGLGPAPVQAGQRFALAGAMSRFVGIADVARTALPEPDKPTVLRFIPGPRDDYFARGARNNSGLIALQQGIWEVSPDSNRVGLRLAPVDGAAPLERIKTTELPSEPVLRGSLQVPPSGEPVLFLADHPVTGGYPVIGVIVRSDVDLAAQLAPGSPVSFQQVDPETLLPVLSR